MKSQEEYTDTAFPRLRSMLAGMRHGVGFQSWRALPRNFRKAATRENLYYSLKVGIAALMAYVLAQRMGLEYSLWAPMSAIIVMQVHVSASVEVSLMRLLGTVAGAGVGLGAAVLMPRIPGGIWMAVVLVGSFCAFLELWEPRFRMAGITAVLVMFMGGPESGDATKFATDRVIEMTTGILSALVVSAVLWPASITEDLHKSLDKQMEEAAKLLEKMTAAFVDGQQTQPLCLLDTLFADVSGNASEFSKVRSYELFYAHRDYPHMGGLIRLVDGVRMHLDGMLEALNGEAGEPVTLDFGEEILQLAQATAQGMRWIAAQTENSPGPVRDTIEAGAVRFASLRSQGMFQEYPPAKVMQVFAFYNSLCHVAEMVAAEQARMAAGVDEDGPATVEAGPR